MNDYSAIIGEVWSSQLQAGTALIVELLVHRSGHVCGGEIKETIGCVVPIKGTFDVVN